MVHTICIDAATHSLTGMKICLAFSMYLILESHELDMRAK